ncbi:MAG: hypothetical protein WDK96_02470 [Candidatus Paceibacterota bacterium]|jgi:hypothetical protein
MESSKKSLLEKPAIQTLIKNREIKSEDFWIIDELLTKYNNGDLVTTCTHNLFSGDKEKSVDVIKRILMRYQEIPTEYQEQNKEYQKKIFEDKKRVYELFLTFCEKYGWQASENLEIALVRSKREN